MLMQSRTCLLSFVLRIGSISTETAMLGGWLIRMMKV